MPVLKAGLTENKEYRGDIEWPTLAELEVPQEFKDANEEWYKIGMNRQRQKECYLRKFRKFGSLNWSLDWA